MISNGLLGEFSILDIFVILNYFQSRKTNKNLRKLQRLQILTMLYADEDLDKIIDILKESKK